MGLMLNMDLGQDQRENNVILLPLTQIDNRCLNIPKTITNEF